MSTPAAADVIISRIKKDASLFDSHILMLIKSGIVTYLGYILRQVCPRYVSHYAVDMFVYRNMMKYEWLLYYTYDISNITRIALCYGYEELRTIAKVVPREVLKEQMSCNDIIEAISRCDFYMIRYLHEYFDVPVHDDLGCLYGLIDKADFRISGITIVQYVSSRSTMHIDLDRVLDGTYEVPFMYHCGRRLHPSVNEVKFDKLTPENALTLLALIVYEDEEMLTRVTFDVRSFLKKIAEARKTILPIDIFKRSLWVKGIILDDVYATMMAIRRFVHGRQVVERIGLFDVTIVTA